MKTFSYNHLDEQKITLVIDKLQKLLANYQIYYTNLRGFHWNITGQQFFRLHEKFEELYEDSSVKIDDIAERILALNGSPISSFKWYLENSAIDDVEGVACGESAVKTILEGISTLILKEKEVMVAANDANDESTAAMMGDYIREQEKLVWMLVAYFTDKCHM